MLALILLTGCAPIGNNAVGMNIIYAFTALFSFVLLAGYCCFIKRREPWFIVLFSSVFIVNAGYFWLSISSTLGEALFANRLSYLGSVFLPLSMLMIILDVSRLNYKKRILFVLFPITVFVFLVAASYPWLDIYYKNVIFESTNGVSCLVKEYGSWHSFYFLYLICYFAIMIAIIIHGKIKKTIESTAHEVILLIAVFVNICVWLMEQLVDIKFEFLSISYIITELFLLGLHLVIHDKMRIESEYKARSEQVLPIKTEIEEGSAEFALRCSFFSENLHTLTPTESAIFDLYVKGMGTKEVLAEMNITQNTLKYHNKNIYSKLGVSSRKQLLECAAAMTKST